MLLDRSHGEDEQRALAIERINPGPGELVELEHGRTRARATALRR
jgi:hypothetical protein